MTDLLTREDVEIITQVWWPNIQKLCQDYLTRWDRNKELEVLLRGYADEAMEKLTRKYGAP